MDGPLEEANEAPPRAPRLPPPANGPALVWPPVAPPLPLPATVRPDRKGRGLAVTAFACGLGGPALFFLAEFATFGVESDVASALFLLSPLSALAAVLFGIAGMALTKTWRNRGYAVVGFVLGAMYVGLVIWAYILAEPYYD